jgi:formylglycine-generating enzyme required for sulfatase activity
MVSWGDAFEFCKKATTELRQRKLLGDDEVIRMPSEAEWEYACRAGSTTAYSFGDKEDDLKDYAWFKGNAKGEDPPVGVKKPNAWGLYDTYGYTWEWCQDDYHANYENAPDDGSPWPGFPKSESVKSELVLRGGSWADTADRCRSSFRFSKLSTYKDDTIGFRCVKAPKGKD